MPFVRRHKLLCVFFLISVLLMIKNSSIPYFFTPSAVITFIFDAPQSAFLSGIAQIVDIFTSAYVTSLLFYYIVDFRPAYKQECKAKKIMEPKLVSLYLYISELLAMIEYSAKQDNLFQSGKIEEMDKLSIRDKVILCKRKSLNNEIESGTAAHSYNLLKDCDKYRTLILNVCEQISCTPSFSYCDTQLINIISKLQLSELLRMLPKPDNFLLRFDFEEISYMGLGVGYQQLVEVRKSLSHFIDTRLACEMIGISAEEIKKWQRDQSETLKQYPELAQILLGTQSKPPA